MHRIKYLPKSTECLVTIQDYYALEFNSDVAPKVRASIIKAINRLSEFPYSGSLTPDPMLNDMGFRMVISKNHAAIHRVIENSVIIYYVADTRTEYTKLFAASLGFGE